MCRNIKSLFNFDPPATDEEIRNASLQFVRKVSGFTKPSKINEVVFDQGVADIVLITGRLMKQLVTNADPKSREIENERARVRIEKRYKTKL